jgi:phosphoribosyl-ATP pyrophosphohydrolase
MSDPTLLHRLSATIAARKAAPPSTSYVAALFDKGHGTILDKVAEESAETLSAAKDGDRLHLIREVADLWFHCLVLLAWHDASADDVLNELQRREGVSGIDEKAARKR